MSFITAPSEESGEICTGKPRKRQLPNCPNNNNNKSPLLKDTQKSHLPQKVIGSPHPEAQEVATDRTAIFRGLTFGSIFGEGCCDWRQKTGNEHFLSLLSGNCTHYGDMHLIPTAAPGLRCPKSYTLSPIFYCIF